ncbi:MAG: fumarylacetoacetate hydrolase family protein [Planctomycetota bacterium]
MTLRLFRYRNSNGKVGYADDRGDHGVPVPGITGRNLFDRPLDQWEAKGDSFALPKTRLPPVPRGEKILCIGLNYRDHAKETGAKIPTEPVVFSKFNSTRRGHEQPIVLPTIAKHVDYEAELVVVIGRKAKQVDESAAMECVYGYTAGHDVSARDWQKGRPGGQWLLGKSFDSFAPMGPVMVSREALDPNHLSVKMSINGVTRQDGNTDQLIFPIAKIVSHISSVMTLRPGDVIFTGTPAGVGAARNPPLYLNDGDVCEVSIDGIGVLRNACVAAN